MKTMPVSVNTSQHYKGFTLIELLLVIALISAMSAVGLSMYKRWAEQVKIEKTALQIEQWLSAGMTYYASEGHWPEKYQDIENYLPIAHEKNPWGKPYNFSSENQGKVFRVVTAVPTLIKTGGLNMSLILARRIAGRLPNASVNAIDGAEDVIAEVGIPGEDSSKKQHAELISITPIDAERDVRDLKPTDAECPPDQMHPAIYFALTGFNAPYIDPNSSASPIVDLSTTQQIWNPTNGAYRYTAKGVNGSVTHNGQLLAIVTCEPGQGQLQVHANEDNGSRPPLVSAQANFIF